MASKKIHIKNFMTEIPGGLNDDKTVWRFPPISSKMKSGKQRSWQINVKVINTASGAVIPVKAEWFDGENQLPANLSVVTYVLTKQEDAETFDKREETHTTTGKNLGKANATNAFTQALRDALSKYNKHHKSSIAHTHEQSDDVKVENATKPVRAPRYKPMLVKRLSDAPLTPEDFARGIFIQRKFNGVRTVMCEDAGAGEVPITAYSRNLNEYPGFIDVKRELLKLFTVARQIYPAAPVYFDGEIYKHGEMLQNISGAARKELEGQLTTGIPYYIYDLFVPVKPTMPYIERKALLDAIFAAAPASPLLHNAETIKVASMEEVKPLYEQFLREGYEGAILRKAWCEYRYSNNNYHSSNLLKLKPDLDEEFKIVGYTGDGKGKAKGAIMFVLQSRPELLPDKPGLVAKEFPVTPGGITLPERKKLFEEMGKDVGGQTLFERDYKGRYMTIKFPEYTADGVPSRATTDGIIIRSYE